MDALTVYLPISQIHFSIPLLLGIGVCVGILSGFFGVGGGWIVTPALNMFGFNMSFAIGTDLAYIFGQSIIATKKHRKLGNVDAKLGLISIIGSVAGVELGAQSVLALERLGSIGPVVRSLYMVLLFGLGVLMANDYYRATRRDRTSAAAPSVPPQRSLSQRVRSVRIPPMISLPDSHIDEVSLVVVVAIFAVTGFLSGFMGVGGGFILLPALIYLVGCPTAVAVGTSLFCVLLMAGYGSFSYALKGRTEIIASVIMLVGAALGAQVGVLATRYVRGYGIRLLFAIMILIAGASVALKQAQQVLDVAVLGPIAGYVVLAAAGTMSLVITSRLVQGAIREREGTRARRKEPAPGASPAPPDAPGPPKGSTSPAVTGDS
jgi:uncharacterized membrane protein YfcA